MDSITIDAKELDKLRQKFDGFSERRMRAAIATAMTRTAIKAKEAAKQQLSRSIDRPTPYTIRQLRNTMAKADNLVTAVGFNIAPIQDVYGNVVRYEDLGNGQTPAGKYIGTNVVGGQRRDKRFEKALQAAGVMPPGMFAIPSKYVQRDQYGNVPGGIIKQILSQIGTELTAGHNRTLKRKPGETLAAFKARAAAAYGRAGGRYFAVKKKTGNMMPGIYLATGRNFGRKLGFGVTGSAMPVFFFASKAVYKRRYALDDVINRTFKYEFDGEMQRAFDEHLARIT